MARAIWSGTVSFGLVNVPVKAVSAVRDHDVHFHQIVKRTGARIRYRKVSERSGREVEDDHYGTNITVVLPGIDPDTAIRRALAQRPDVDPESLVAHGWDGAADLVRRYVEGGLTKFVVRPAGPVADWQTFIDEFTAEMGPLQD